MTGYPWEDPPVQTKSGRLVKKLKGRLSQDKNWMKEVSSRAVFENCILNRSPTDHDVIYDDEVRKKLFPFLSSYYRWYTTTTITS